MRICSEDYIEEECNHIKKTFHNLKYPQAFIVDCYNKAKKIRTRANSNKDERPKVSIIVVPRSKYSNTIAKSVKRSGIRLIEQSGQKIGQIVQYKRVRTQCDNSLVYKIPCKGCTLPYYGETSRGLKKRIEEHKRDLRNHDTKNSLVKHLEDCPYLPDWEHADILKKGLSKTNRKILESSLIEAFPCNNSKAGDVKLAKSVAIVLVEEHLGRNAT